MPSSDSVSVLCRTVGGQEFSIDYSNMRPSTYCISVHKAGSVLLFQLVGEIARAAQLPACDFYSQLFSKGVSAEEVTVDSLSIFQQKSVIYYGFRNIDQVRLVRDFWGARKLILIRDPRDIAVSFYFSMMRSHVLPTSARDRARMHSNREQYQGLSVSDYVLCGHADVPLRNLESYLPFLSDTTTNTFYKYEDIISEKRKWVADLAQQLGAELAPDVLDNIADRYDIVPESENAENHIRQVHPGNYRKHLNKMAVNYIEQRFKALFDAFGYPLASN